MFLKVLESLKLDMNWIFLIIFLVINYIIFVYYFFRNLFNFYIMWNIKL